MAHDYDHKEIETKWQKRWEEAGLYRTESKVSGKENHYTLVEFPYPSGDLHVGHWYAFAVPDIYARMKRMQGHNVLYPIGFDAFGLPAENAAIKHGADPAKWTQENIDRMRGQLKQMGNMFDWDREVAACDPSMYRWTQWLFLQLFKKGLAYHDTALVNWDPVDQTVLANEQVLPDGTAERSGAKVEKRELEQWFLKITDYADRLIDDLDYLDWPHSIKEAQKNWIGRSEGAEIDFELVFKAKPLKNEVPDMEGKSPHVRVFTTRADTLFGATYLVLAPEHPWAKAIWDTDHDDVVENKDEVVAYAKQVSLKSELERQESKEKTGVELKGIKAINPATKEEIPVFIADYVLGHYGTGAIMAVPAHDERDYEFAKKFDLPIKQVMTTCVLDADNPPQEGMKEVVRDTVIVHLRDKKSGNYAVLDWHGTLEGITTAIMGGIEPNQTPEEAALAEIFEETAISNAKIISKGSWVTAAKYCASHKGENRCAIAHAFLAEVENLETQGEVSEAEQKLHTLSWVTESEIKNRLTPVHQKQVWDILHSDQALIGEGFVINSDQFNGLETKEAKKKITEFAGGKITKTYRQRDWLISRQRYWGTPIPIVYDPEGKPHAVPDEHLPWLLPTDVDFTPTGKAPLATSKELVERTEKIFGEGWKPEVDTMDTFMDSSWYFLRYLDPKNEEKFASRESQKQWMPVNRYSGGAEHTTMHILYSRFFYKALYDLGIVTENEPYQVRMNRGIILAEDGRKMSKRWGNTINPDEQVQNVGADSVKTYLAFIGPYNEVGSYPWSTNGLVGVRRFLEKVWTLSEKVSSEVDSTDVEVLLHQTVKKVGEDIESMKFNTSVSALMILVNELQKKSAVNREVYETLLKILAPFAPHMTEELWERVGNTASIHLEPWPEYDPEKTIGATVTIAVQIAGKVRGTIDVAREANEGEVINEAKNNPKLAKYLDFEPQKVIFVPGRVINLIP